jgi:hypothetical protein
VNAAPGLAVWVETFVVLAVSAGALVGLAALLACRLRRAAWQRTVWRAALLGLALLLAGEATGLSGGLLGWAIEALRGGAAPADPLPGRTDEPAARESPAVAVGDPIDDFTEPESTVSESAPAAPVESGAWWPGLVWLLGTALVAGRSLVGRGLLLVFRRRHPPSRDEALCERVRLVAGRLGFRRKVRVLEVAGLCSPAAFGVVRPTVAVPAGFTKDFDGPRQEVMLAHELAHLAARDPAWLFLADLVTAVLWWHPLAWLARERLRAASETAADEASLVVADGPGLLASCLVELGTRLAAPGVPGGVRMAGSGFRSNLGRRVERLLRLRGGAWRPPGLPSRLALSLGVAALVAGAVLSTAWARPRASQEGDVPMTTVQRSWRHSLAGALLCAALASADDTTGAPGPPAGAPPGVPGSSAGGGQRPSRTPGQEADASKREKQRVVQMLRELDDKVVAAQKEAERAPDLATVGGLKKRLEELKAQKAKLEEDLKVLQQEAEEKVRNAKHIRVFRLKHVKPEEVRQALESLLGDSAGAGGPPGMGGPGPMGPGGGMTGMTPPGGMKGGSPAGGGMVGGPPAGGGPGRPGMMPGPGMGSGMMMGMRDGGWRVTVDERTGSIIVRGSRGDLQRAADLIALLDLPGGKPLPRVKNLQAFKLKYAQADKIAQILDELGINARILPLSKTNRLIVAGPDAVVKEIAELIAELDVEAGGSQ